MYGSKYASSLCSLRPRWTTFLTILRALSMPSPTTRTLCFRRLPKWFFNSLLEWMYHGSTEIQGKQKCSRERCAGGLIVACEALKKSARGHVGKAHLECEVR